MFRLSSIALTTVLIAPTYTGLAQERVEAGVLQCRGSTTSFVVGSVTELNCTFVPSAGGPTESYMARMKRAGLDIGINQQVAITWGVFAPTRLRRGERRYLCRRCRQRNARSWRRSKRAMGWIKQHGFPTTSQRSGTNWVERRCRRSKPSAARRWPMTPFPPKPLFFFKLY